MRLRLSKIHEQSMSRPLGYYDHVISMGVIEGDFLEISTEALAELRELYRPPTPMLPLLDAPASVPDEPDLPSLAVRARNLAGQSAAEALAITRGVPPVTSEETARRIGICRSNKCGNWRSSDETCALCGCPMVRKAPWRTAKCDAGMW